MAYTCDKCGRIRDDDFALENDFVCTSACGGFLQPLVTATDREVSLPEASASHLEGPAELVREDWTPLREIRLGEHLRELLNLLQVLPPCWLGGSILGWVVLEHPWPGRLLAATVYGLIAIWPVLTIQLWRFMLPGLRTSERLPVLFLLPLGLLVTSSLGLGLAWVLAWLDRLWAMVAPGLVPEAFLYNVAKSAMVLGCWLGFGLQAQFTDVRRGILVGYVALFVFFLGSPAVISAIALVLVQWILLFLAVVGTSAWRERNPLDSLQDYQPGG